MSLDDIRSLAYALQRATETYQSAGVAVLKSAFDAYAEAVAAVNQRLRAAHALLRQGRRSEALHACDAEPNLLDCMQELDASDQLAAEWHATLDELGIDKPEPLATDLAADLNAAYDSKHQLASLTRALRLLAIGRGPLEERVSVLRRIAALDADNPIWLEDLRTHEHHCRSGLRAELDRIAQLADDGLTSAVAARADTVVRRLCEADWQEPLPGDEVDRVRRVGATIAARRAAAELRRVGADLAAAHDRGDVAAARSLAERWDALEPGAGDTGHDNRLFAARAARDWVADHDARQQRMRDAEAAAAAIRHLCDAGVPFQPSRARELRERFRSSLAELRAAAYEPEAAEAVADVVAAALQRVAQLDRVPWRAWGLLGGAACAALAVAGWGVARFWEASQKRAVLARVEREVLAEEVPCTDISRVWNTLTGEHAWLLKAPIAKKVNDRRETCDEAYRKDREALSKDVDALAKEVEDVPEKIKGFEDNPPAYSKAKQALVRVQASITAAGTRFDEFRKEHPGADVTEVDKKYKDCQEALKKHNEDFKTAVANFKKDRDQAIDKDLDALEKLPTPDVPTKGMADVRKKVDDYAVLFGNGEPVDSWRKRLGDVETSIALHESLKKIRTSLDQAARKGLADYLEDVAMLAKDDLVGPATDLTRVADTATAVKAALDWAAVGKAWNEKEAFDPAKAGLHKAWRDRLKQVLESSPRPADCDEAARPLLEQLLEIQAEHDANPSGFLAVLEHELLLKILREDVKEYREQDGSGGEDVYYTNLTRKEERYLYFRDAKVCDRWGLIANPAQLPQARHVPLVRHLNEAIVEIEGKKVGIDDGLERMFSKFPAEGVDVLLQCRLLSLLIDCMQQRPAFQEIEELKNLRNDIRELVGDDPVWVDPKERKKADKDQAAQKVLANGPFKAVRDQYKKWRSSVVVRPKFCRPLQFHGWLDKGETGLRVHEVEVRTNVEGTLVVVRPKKGDESYELVTIGRVEKGKATVTAAVDSALFGEPVFVETAD